MTTKPAIQPKDGGLRGSDKQQDALRDQNSGQGIVRTERGEDQPKDKARAQQDSGRRMQKEAALRQPQSPGQPAGGE